MEPLTLRRAGAEDCLTVFGWANDPVTRAASFRSDPIPLAAHEAWWASSLRAPSRHLYIAQLGAAPAGFLRLDVAPDNPRRATVSINVAAELRGRGLGAPMLRLLEAESRALGVEVIVAFIRAENGASLAVFRRAGYEAVGEEAVEGAAAWRYERRLSE